MQHAARQRFTDVCSRVGIVDDGVGAIFDSLLKHYSEEHRSYHNLSHIDRMLNWLGATRISSEPIELAIWFHDAIYDPKMCNNEAKSAEFFLDHLGPFIEKELAAEVVRLIMATDPKRSRSGRSDEDSIIDIDLSILGSSPEEYEVYRSAIRQEYISIAEDDFNAGRASILNRFLSQRIFATEFFAALEQQARTNIRAEIVMLDSKR